ncbi:MAG: DNA-binding response regulator [Firmicutes bacterium HGW-Firmicutes-5]|nr:MAG: DNA-binding response regulator [Firmicutes bacterium HGW-Firmicutes-5]
MHPKNILVVEDEPKILEFISSYIRNSGYNPIIAENGQKALHLFNSESIDLILLDLMLPDLSGEEICKTIREKSNVPIIMITAKTDEESIIVGLNMGADDYITKPFSPRQLVARINALFRRSDLINNSEPQTTGPFRINDIDYTVLLNGQNLLLTATEYQLFTVLLGRPTKVFTRDELASIAFTKYYEGYNRSIDSHIKNIRSKISNYTPDNYIRTIRGIGYQYCDQERCE